MAEGAKVAGSTLELDDFQNAFMPQYNELAEVLDKKALSCQEIIRFLEPFVENERTYAQNVDKIIQQRMPVYLPDEEPGLFNVWSIFKQWGSTLKANAAETHKEFRAAKDELDKCYAAFDQERKKFSSFLTTHQKEFGTNMRKLTKARDRYYKRCQNELSQPLPDTKQMKVDKDNYWSQLVLANNSLKLFYSFDLPKHLESAEKALLARVDGVQNCIRRIVGVKKTSCESLGACNVLVLDAISATGDAKGDLSALAHKYNKESVPFQTIPQFVYQEYSSTALSRAAPVPEANVPEELVLGRPRRKSGPEPDLVKILFESDSSLPQIGTKKNDLPLGDGKDPHQQQTAPLAVAAPAVAKDNVNSDNVNSCNKKVFGVSLNELMERQKRRKDGGAEKEEEEEEEEEERLPVIAKYFVESLLRMKVEAVPSIFKRGGKALTVAELKKGIDNGVLTPLTDPYVCADVFKFWIRSLPEPLIPNTLYNEAIKCSADTEAFEVYKKLPEPNKSVVEYISHFLYNLSKHSKATSLNETSLASLFAPCLMRHTSTDIKEMIAASEKQASFVLALLDAAAAGLIPGSLFERSVGACNSDDNGESNSTGLESEVSCDTKWVSPARTPMSTPPPPLRPVNCTKGELLPTPLRVKRIPPQPTNPPPLPPELEKK